MAAVTEAGRNDRADGVVIILTSGWFGDGSYRESKRITIDRESRRQICTIYIGFIRVVGS